MTTKNYKIKAVIPMAGVGTKLRPHTFTQPKPLIPVAGKPIISHIIDNFLENGIDEFVIIIGYLGDKIRRFVQENYPRLKVEFVFQAERLGLGHALWIAQEALQTADEVIISLGDTIVAMDFEGLLNTPGSSIAVSTVQTPGDFGILEVGDDGFLTKAIEKPTIPISNIGIVGVYKFDNIDALVSALNKVVADTPKTGDEYNLTEVIMSMINAGEKITTLEVIKWFDCGRKDVLLETNATLLAEFKQSNEVELTNYESSIILQPVAIGENCILKNSIIGPNVTIGENTTIISSILDNSIVGSFSELQEVVMRNSIIGNDSLVKGQHLNLNIGENTEIEFG